MVSILNVDEKEYYITVNLKKHPLYAKPKKGKKAIHSYRLDKENPSDFIKIDNLFDLKNFIKKHVANYGVFDFWADKRARHLNSFLKQMNDTIINKT